MATITDSPDTLERGGKFFSEQLRAEVFRQQIRRDAKRMVEEDERTMMGDLEAAEPKLVYDPLPAEKAELMPGLLPESGTAAIIGETDTGKSLIACEIGSSLLTGEPLWQCIEPTRKIDKVVYILGEHTCTTLQGLFHRTRLPHEGKFLLLGPEHLHPYKALVVGGVQQQTAVDRLIRWCDGAGLIVFDPLAGFVQGMSAENDNATMRTLIDSMSLVATKVGACCLILSHMGKPMIGPDGSEIRRQTYASRGATAVEDALTHIFYLRKALKVKQQSDGEVELYDLVVRKYKGSPDAEVYRLRRDPVTKRNSLLRVKTPKGSYPSLEDKRELRDRVMRTVLGNPDFTQKTAVRVVAAGANLAVDTLERWLSEVEGEPL